MLLSEQEIATRMASEDSSKRLVISPLISARHQFGPSSIDVRLGTDFSTLKTANLSHIDTTQRPEKLKEQVGLYTETIRLAPTEIYHLHPGEFVLATTLEFIRLPSDLAARIEGRSSWGRLGLLVHATAGYVDPGFSGVLTFELLNSGYLPIALRPGLRIGQICFFGMQGRTLLPYGNKEFRKYQGAMSVQASRLADDPEIGH